MAFFGLKIFFGKFGKLLEQEGSKQFVVFSLSIE